MNVLTLKQSCLNKLKSELSCYQTFSCFRPYILGGTTKLECDIRVLFHECKDLIRNET